MAFASGCITFVVVDVVSVGAIPVLCERLEFILIENDIDFCLLPLLKCWRTSYKHTHTYTRARISRNESVLVRRTNLSNLSQSERILSITHISPLHCYSCAFPSLGFRSLGSPNTHTHTHKPAPALVTRTYSDAWLVQPSVFAIIVHTLIAIIRSHSTRSNSCTKQFGVSLFVWMCQRKS